MVNELTCLRVPNTEIGYGRMGMELVAALERQGYQIRTDQDQPTGTLVHFSIPGHLLKWYDGQRLVILTMFESATLPEAFRETLHHFDTVVVPSEQNREMFAHYHPDVRVIDLGIDPELWKPTSRITPRTRFTFLHGGSGIRKGGDVAYRAFRQAFPPGSWGDGPEPWLVLKSPRPSDFFGERVEQINGRIPAEEEIRLYERAHCYVQPSRGEGFGLQPLQAIVQGLPTILTDAHGHKAFSHLGWPVEASLSPTPRGSFMLGEAGDWWEPDIDQVAEHMRWIYDNYSGASSIAYGNAKVAHARFTWDNSATQLMEIVGEPLPYTGSGEILTPKVKRYRTVLLKPHAADIAGHSFRWEAGVEYFEHADIKRILFEGDYLDPSCLDGDSGLTEEQAERAAKISGRDATCPTCHQTLNSRRTSADLVEAGEW